MEWNWTHEQDEAFERIIAAVTTAPVLQYFDSSKPTESCGDASSQGLGFVLTQEDHPKSYANRALTAAEQRYSQIEKELLAQMFGLEHNHYYTYGRRVILHVEREQTTSIDRDQTTCFNNQTPPASPTPIATMRRRDQILTRQRDVPGGHPVKSIPTEQPQIRSRERRREHTSQLEEIQKETLKDPTLQVVKKTVRFGGMA